MAASNGRKTSSSSKKTTRSTAAKASARTRKADAARAAQDSALFHEIGLIVLFAAMVFFSCCNFGFIGPVGDAVSGVLFGLFGLCAYVLPVLLFLAVAFWFANTGNPGAVRKLVAGSVLFLMAGVVCDLLAKGAAQMEEYSAAKLYEVCRDAQNGGGVLGGSISFFLQGYLETIGTILVVLLCTVVSLILLTEKSLLSSMKQGGSRMRELSREDSERRREIASARRAEKEEQALRRREMAEARRLEQEEEARNRRQAEEEQRARRAEERRLKSEEKENEKILRAERKKSVSLDNLLIGPEKSRSRRDDMHEIILSEEELGAGQLPEDVQADESIEPGNEGVQILGAGKRKTDKSTGKVSVQAQEERIQNAESMAAPKAEDFLQPNIRIHKAEPDLTAESTPGPEPLSGGRGSNSESGNAYTARLRAMQDRPVVSSQVTDAHPEENALTDAGYGTCPQEEYPEADSQVEADQASNFRVGAERIPAEDDFMDEADSFSASGYETDITQFSQAGYGKETQILSKGANQAEKAVSREKNRQAASLPQNAQASNPVAGERVRPEVTEPKKYMFPPLSILQKGSTAAGDSERELKETAMHLQQTLSTFGVKVTITDISQGPSVTRYELQPEQGVKVSKIVGLADDIKLNLAAMDIRIEAPIPGKAAIGIEVPNKETMPVGLRDLLETKKFQDFPSNIAFAVGKDIAGQVVVADIAKMPHMLIAGATGSGKSVCINTLIMSILFKAHPDDVKLIMVDPKVVELSVYNGIPHLLIPVVTDPKKASAALNWGVSEMDDRYRKFAEYGVRNLKEYNKKVEVQRMKGDENAPKKLPQIIIIVDELADLMMVCPGEVEASICRLAQLARACGIHLVIATQRPSVDVITGLIKANMPSRVAFSVSSGTDSRTILDMVGAEKLLGKGDMLFYPQGYPKPARVQGAFVSDEEVSEVVDFLKNQALGNTYADEIEEKIATIGNSSTPGGNDKASGDSNVDELFEKAGRLIIDKDKASIGMLQRALQIGFNRAARIMDQLCQYGVVGEEEGTKPRKILMSPEQFEQLLEEVT